MTDDRQTNVFDRAARVGFLLLVAVLPIIRPLSFYAGGLRIEASDLIFVFVALAWIISFFKDRNIPKIKSFHWFLGLYAAALTLSAVFSSEPQRSFFKLVGEFYLFGLAVVAYSLVKADGFVKQITFAWLAGTAITIAATLIGFVFFYLGYKTQADNYFLSHAGSLPDGNYPRIHALFANANMMCNFLNVSLMLSLLAGELGWIKKWMAYALTAGIWFAALFTLSSGLGGIILSTGLWFGALTANKKILSRSIRAAAVIGALLILAVTIVSPDTANTDRGIVLGNGTSIEPSVRVLVWEDSLRTFAEHPLLGKGVGTDPASIFYTTLSGQKQVLSDAHNMYLSVLAQSGLLGFAAFALLLTFLARRFAFGFAGDRKTILTALSCSIIGAIFYQGITGSFEDARHLWVLIGIFAGVSYYKEDSASAPSEAAAK